MGLVSNRWRHRHHLGFFCSRDCHRDYLIEHDHELLKRTFYQDWKKIYYPKGQRDEKHTAVDEYDGPLFKRK